MPTVSYVVTLYNKAPFLPFVLRGLAGQTGDFERQMIFVDDGSTDATVATLRAMTADWPNVTIVEQANAGPAAATNAGLARVEGDFVKPVDGDDMLTPWATAYLLAALAETGCSVAIMDGAHVGHYRLEDSPAAALRAAAFEPARIEREYGSLRKSLRLARTNPTCWLATAAAVRQAVGCDTGVFIQDYSAELRLAAVGDFARVANTLFLAPAPTVTDGRLSGNEAQILHDLNLALIRFLRERPDLDRTLRNYGMRRASGRAWIWASRSGRKTPFSRAFANRALALVGLLPPSERNEDLVCAPFRETAKIRRVGA